MDPKVKAVVDSLKEYLRYSYTQNLDDLFIFERAQKAIADLEGIRPDQVQFLDDVVPKPAEYTGNEGASEYNYQDGYGDAEYIIRERGIPAAVEKLAITNEGSFSWAEYRNGYQACINAALDSQYE